MHQGRRNSRRGTVCRSLHPSRGVLPSIHLSCSSGHCPPLVSGHPVHACPVPNLGYCVCPISFLPLATASSAIILAAVTAPWPPRACHLTSVSFSVKSHHSSCRIIYTDTSSSQEGRVTLPLHGLLSKAMVC